MLKKVVALLFLSGSAYALTAQQIQAVYAASDQINSDSAKIVGMYATFGAGTYTVQGSTQTYTLSPAQGQDLLNQYNALKTDMCSVQCGSLP